MDEEELAYVQVPAGTQEKPRAGISLEELAKCFNEKVWNLDVDAVDC